MKYIKYMKENHGVLIKDGIYEVRSESKTHVQVITKTGFAGVPKNDVIEHKI